MDDSAPKNFCPNAVGKSWQVLASDGKQSQLPLISSMHPAPKDAPGQLVRQIESAGQAVAVSMVSCGAKLAYVAACLGRSESYVSRIRSGERPVPHWMIEPFCRITGTNLLKQHLALHEAIAEAQRQVSPRQRAVLLARLMEAA